MILAVLSLVGGFGHGGDHHYENANAIMVASVLVAIFSASFAFYRYRKFSKEEVTNSFIEKGLGFDVFYSKFFGKGTNYLARILSRWIEDAVIQNSLKFCSWVVELSGNVLKAFQVGSMQVYLMMMMVLGLALMIWVFQGSVNGVFSYGN
jgi:NADH:ubiquinone oxidoreductase subunit 5 (subunit L)/multisubunit Na+/H+ antiporter MnhA subunit